jgi:hypothetical protein
MGKVLQGKQWAGGEREGAALCDICGGRFRRSQLVTNADGYLVCSGPGTNDDADGLTITEAAALESSRAATLGLDHDHAETVGGYDHGDT